MKRVYSLIISVLFFPVILSAQSRGDISRSEYIEMYKEMAISEMLRSGVPASITLAQGMLESDNGNSTLAVKANNHFGIKCHNAWKGPRVYHDDDKKGECFRKYKSADESFRDHSDFLMSGSRYSFLFELEMTDYKGWAKGLKKAGYATSNTYADKLIRIIEENNLHEYDLEGASEAGPAKVRRRKGKTAPGAPGAGEVLVRNRVKYIIVKPEDTFRSLQEEFDLLPYEIYKYNDMNRDEELTAGQVVYLQPKRKKAEAGNSWHTVKEGETMLQISQMYAVKTDRLYRMNLMEPGQEPAAGDRISLRKQVSGVKPSKVKEDEPLREEKQKSNGEKNSPKREKKPAMKERKPPQPEEPEESGLRFEFDQ